MPRALLDVNVLLALAWPIHLHHDAAHRWFADNRQHGWATCPHTQAGFLRLSLQPAVVKTSIGFPDTLGALENLMASPEHEFWAQEVSIPNIQAEILARIAGHHQLADAVLLDLAIRRGGRLATLDRRIRGLLPEGSPHLTCIDLIAA